MKSLARVGRSIFLPMEVGRPRLLACARCQHGRTTVARVQKQGPMVCDNGRQSADRVRESPPLGSGTWPRYMHPCAAYITVKTRQGGWRNSNISIKEASGRSLCCF
ncbi:hypothetical protein MPTK1_8g03370 [Marchantia polymorpha subsp. ruderalis]